MRLTTQDALYHVLAERRRQDQRWGFQDHAPAGWLALMAEELGEVARAALERKPEDYPRELVQLAALAVAALECLSRQTEVGSANLGWALPNNSGPEPARSRP